MVLLDDDFASLVHGVAVHLLIVGLTLVPIAMGWPLVLMPIHIAFLHLVIDPACSATPARARAARERRPSATRRNSGSPSVARASIVASDGES